MTPRPAPRGLRALMRRVRLVVFDFDGVMTDNAVLVFADGTEAVRCWRGDGLGLRALRESGVDAFVLSTEVHPVVQARCRKLGVECAQGCEDKPSALKELVRARGIALEEVAYVGNDVNDLGCLELVGLPIVVQDAHHSVAAAARWRTTLPGGHGAVREVCDAIAQARAAGRPGRKRAS